MRKLALAAIQIYKRHISPRKGFCCAYRAHTGRQSCSTLGFRAIRRFGFFNGMQLLRRRTYLCGVAHRRYGGHIRNHWRKQSGHCDLGGCDLPADMSCHFPDFHHSCSFTDVLSGCSNIGTCDCGSCDWPFRRKGKKDEELYVRIPPNIGQ